MASLTATEIPSVPHVHHSSDDEDVHIGGVGSQSLGFRKKLTLDLPYIAWVFQILICWIKYTDLHHSASGHETEVVLMFV